MAARAAEKEESTANVATPMMLSANEEGVAVASVQTVAETAGSSMATAISLPLESWVDGCICCPENDWIWYKFTVPSNAENTTYTVHTRGSLNMVGALCNSAGTTLDSDNDGIKCKMVADLTAGVTYYVKLKAHKSGETGGFYVRATERTIVDSVAIQPQTIVLARGRIYELPGSADRTFSNVTDKPSAPLTVSVQPYENTEKRVFWYEFDRNNVIEVTEGFHEDSGEKYTTIKAKSAGTATLYVSDWYEYGLKATVNVVVREYYNIINKETGDAVSVSGEFGSRPNVYPCNPNNSNEQIWGIEKLSSESEYYFVRAYLDDDYGFNAYKIPDGNYNCDLIKVSGNEDAKVLFVPSEEYEGYYKIKFMNNPNYCLTLTSDTESMDVRWQNTDQGDRQLWRLEPVDWDQYNAEHMEYHVLCNGDTSKALRVGTRNVLEIDTPLPVRGERLSYWNRQKWTIKGEGTQKRLCSQLNNEYFLCNDGSGNAHVSNNASDSNSHLTIEPYGNTGKYTIKLSGGNLYLTLAYGEYVQDDKTYYAEWGKWTALNTADPSAQLWELKKQPTINQQGVDLGAPISDTTAKILKKNGIKFVCRYYATRDMVDNVEKILTAAEVTRLHNQGLNIVSIYEDGGKSFSTARGISDATEALRLASTLGQPEGSAIYFGVEPEYSDQVNLIEEYFKAVQETFLTDGRYKVGVYGLAKVCNNIKDTLGYAEYSWMGMSTNVSGSLSIEGDSDYIAYDRQEKYNIKQSEPIIYNGVEFDSDTTIKQDYGAW